MRPVISDQDVLSNRLDAGYEAQRRQSPEASLAAAVTNDECRSLDLVIKGKPGRARPTVPTILILKG
jgi:hypothetical protein